MLYPFLYGAFTRLSRRPLEELVSMVSCSPVYFLSFYSIHTIILLLKVDILSLCWDCRLLGDALPHFCNCRLLHDSTWGCYCCDWRSSSWYLSKDCHSTIIFFVLLHSSLSNPSFPFLHVPSLVPSRQFSSTLTLSLNVVLWNRQRPWLLESSCPYSLLYLSFLGI